MPRRPSPHRDRPNSTTSNIPTPQSTSYPKRATKDGIEENGRGEHSGPSERSNRLSIKYAGYSGQAQQQAQNVHRFQSSKQSHQTALLSSSYHWRSSHASLSKAKVFSVLDAKSGFWHNTFNPPFGRYRWLRMPFGISSALEGFQKRMNDTFGDIKALQ